MESLIRQSELEFAINGLGKAILLHKGPLSHDYSWIQYDSYTNTIQLITEDGAIQELGVAVPAAVKTLLDKTREISLIEIGAKRH